MPRALVLLLSYATLAACNATTGARAGEDSPPVAALAANKTSTHGLAFRLPSSWRRARASTAETAQWTGPGGALLVVAGDPAASPSEHQRNLSAMRARAAQSGWTIGDERALPQLGAEATRFEVSVPAQRSTLRLPTWATVIDGRLAIFACAFDANLAAVAEPQCDAIFRSIERSPRTTAATELSRAVSLGSLSALVASSWTPTPQGEVQVFASRDSGERQIVLSMALSPATERVASLDVAAVRQRLSRGASRVSEGTARAINGVDGVAFVVEQPQLRRAAVSELVVHVWHGSRSIAASCMFRTEDREARATCAAVMQSVRRQP